TQTAGLMRLLACLVAAVVFVWQEQKEVSFPPIHLAVVILGLRVLCVSLCLFKRGESRIQPSEKITSTLRFIGRYTLEIYAIQLAGSELLVKLLPDLSPCLETGAFFSFASTSDLNVSLERKSEIMRSSIRKRGS